MGTIDSIQLDMENKIVSENNVKELVINQLVDLGILTKEDGEKFKQEYQIILFKRRWYPSWWNNLKKYANIEDNSKDNEYQYLIVKFNP